jgi:SAM-dependent methyltransferase
MNSPYTTQYYARLREGSRSSAAAIVPLVMELIRPASVIDVGCGTGAWLAAFKQNGVVDVCGIDGDYIDPKQLEVEPREFVAADLRQPLRMGRQYDLAVSLEVAEHLPATLADQFVDSLVTLAPVVLFSAAIPDQGGEEHVNEQWPAYWVDRFRALGYAALDPFRRLLWQQSNMEWWYAQNMLLFIQHDQLPKYSLKITKKLSQAFDLHDVLPLVHPGNYQQHTWQNRVLKTAVDLATVVPIGERIILVDENRFGSLYLPGRNVLPFLEHNGNYAGPPRDDEQAISELCRMQQAGAAYMAFGWPAFWWLTRYSSFAAHLIQYHIRVIENDRLVLFSLRKLENWNEVKVVRS